MRVIIVEDKKRHLFHPLLVSRASRALVDRNRWEFEAVLREFERNYFMEGLMKYRGESFLELLGKYLFLGTVAGFKGAEELVEEARKGLRIVEVGDPYVPFYISGTLFLAGKPVPKEIVKKLPHPIHDLEDDDYIAFLLRLFEHNHRFGIVSCAREFWTMRQALYGGLLRPERQEIWEGEGCFVGVLHLNGEEDGIEGNTRGNFKIACRNGWCVFYFRGSRKRLKGKLRELGVSSLL
ncbi:hypothetical protein FH039_00150 [Thermococcus indicus]|uniref:Uncharacterized protein n=1 Tax=Thermococcus indicus TaxID=2586643 RepID=A0A4Y5SJF6_9EURY|nr:hypothetical protein [Thermococcus indicus]QDA30342.1 hypothetical protein FH039_00150 [Thermococcus indicus]